MATVACAPCFRWHLPAGEAIDDLIECQRIGIGREVLSQILQVLQNNPPEPAQHPGAFEIDALTGVPPKPLLLHVAVCAIVLPVSLCQRTDEDVCIEKVLGSHNHIQEKCPSIREERILVERPPGFRGEEGRVYSRTYLLYLLTFGARARRDSRYSRSHCPSLPL